MDEEELKRAGEELFKIGQLTMEGRHLSKITRTYFGDAWGFYRHLEDIKSMKTCTGLLRQTGLDKEEIILYQNAGFRSATRAIEACESDKKIFDENDFFGF